MKKKIIVFGLGIDFEHYKNELIQKYEIVGVTDHYIVPMHPEWKKLYISPKEISFARYDIIMLVSRVHSVQIRHFLNLYTNIPDEKIKSIEEEIDELDEMHISNLKNRLVDDAQNKNLIYVIGDSHVSFFGEKFQQKGLFIKPFCDEPGRGIGYVEPNISPFIPFHIGPALAFNLNKRGTRTQGREKVDYLLDNWILPNSKILFVLGEIDIRVHVIKQAEIQNVSVETVVSHVVDNYFECLVELSKKYEINVWGAIPSQSDTSGIDINYPRYGNMQDRNIATKKFNDFLKERCDKEGIGFISVYDYLIDDNMRTRTWYYMDNVHLSRLSWAFAKNEFEKIGITVDI